MNAYNFFTFLVGMSVASAAVVVQGPSAKTSLVGPDGSHIVGVAPAGQIITEQHPGVVGHVGHGHTGHGHQVIAAVLVEPQPAHYVAPFPAAAPVDFTAAAFHGGAALHGGHGGAEGQYVHDHSEALYDDGSYKPHLHH